MHQKSELPRKGEKSAARTALRKHWKLKPYDESHEVHVQRLKGESDRGVLVLAPSLIEDALEVAITGSLAGYAPEDHESLFGFESPIGSFSRKTSIAKALGLISRPTADLIDLVRHMRNAAAHVQTDMSFKDEAIAKAVLALVSEETRGFISKEGSEGTRDTFILSCVLLQQIVINPITKHQMPDDNVEYSITYINEHEVIPLLEYVTMLKPSHDADS